MSASMALRLEGSLGVEKRNLKQSITLFGTTDVRSNKVTVESPELWSIRSVHIGSRRSSMTSDEAALCLIEFGLRRSLSGPENLEHSTPY
jgi:hypothetical protein